MIKTRDIRCPPVTLLLGMIQTAQGLLLAGLAPFLVVHPFGLTDISIASFGISLLLGGMFLLIADEIEEPLLARRIGALFPTMNWLTIAYFQIRFGQGIIDGIMYLVLAIVVLIVMWDEGPCSTEKE